MPTSQIHKLEVAKMVYETQVSLWNDMCIAHLHFFMLWMWPNCCYCRQHLRQLQWWPLCNSSSRLLWGNHQHLARYVFHQWWKL